MSQPTSCPQLEREPSQHQQEFIFQQQELISVLKQQIIRLQDEVHVRIQTQLDLKEQLSKATETISFLKDKIQNISENNQSLLRTVHVFQRQFVRREGGALTKLPVEQNGIEGPFHLQIVRNLKSKIGNILIEPARISQKSIFSDYYGFSLQDQSVDESEVLLFNELVQNKKAVRTSRIKSLGKKQYFHQKFRQVFWFNSIDNKQRINQRLYKMILDKYEGSAQNTIPKRSIIDLDLRRMDLRLDDEKSKKMSVQIKKLLQLFQIYRPDIKYVQGMSYLAWIFLIRMSPYQAFLSFCNLILSDPFVFSLYSFDEKKIKMITNYFGECLKDKKPKLFKHLNEVGVDCQLFLIEWAYTLFSRAFSLRIVSKIWDLWFSQGYNTFYKVTMAVLDILQPEILSLNQNDKIIDTIRSGTFKIEQNEFLKVLVKQKLFQQLKLD